MAEYRIVAKIDPQTSAGASKVKQDLRGVRDEANATQQAINRSFDQAAFDKTIGRLITSLDRLDSSLGKVGRGAGATGKGFSDGAAGANRMEAALARVLRATDSEAAEQQRLNALLSDAKRLLDAGVISQERYAQVQAMATKTGKDVVAITGSQRIGMQQLGFQLGDIATMYSLGARPTQIFASQIGQVSQALMLMGGQSGGGVLGVVGRFLGGPWGIALTIATTLLGPFIGKLFESGDALQQQVDKLRDDAKESENTRKAHEIWITTLDALIERQGRLADAMRDRLKVQGLADQSDLAAAQRDKATLDKQIPDAKKKLDDLQQQLRLANAPIALTGGRGDEARLGDQARRVSELQRQVTAAQTELNRLQGAAGDAQNRIIGGQILVGEQQGKALVDLTARAQHFGDTYLNALRVIEQGNVKIRDQAPQVSAGYTLVQQAIEKAAAAGVNFDRTGSRAVQLARDLNNGKIGVAAYRTEMGKLADTLTKAAEAAEKAKHATSEAGNFTSRTQAIGLAGRELQRMGLRVDGNRQFGYTGGHANDADHNLYAIDVNVGKGVTEAKVPDLKRRFDGLALAYQARGYDVIWNGQKYPAFGHGPSGPAAGHDNHLHIYAAQTIVGHATHSSDFAQDVREATKEQTVAEQKSDFVQGIVNQASLQGLPNNRAAQLSGRLDAVLAEYKRRFNEAASPDEVKQITGALTAADAREQSQYFDEAYVAPLKRLQDLQGTTGISRKVLNAQLDETKRLGRELTPVEKETIENGIRRGDQLDREQQVLESIMGPLAEYKAYLTALNDLLAKGSINQTTYNARVADLGKTAAQTALGGLKGVDPGTGRNYEDVTAIADENARYATQLESFQTYREQLLKMGVDYDALEESARQQHADNLAKIDEARRDMAMQSAEDIASTVTGTMKQMFGEQSAMYKAAFAVEKAIAIARAIMAIQTGIAQAAALPFPANLGAIASVVAATASIISNIQAVALNFADGGPVRGPGGPRSDSIPAYLSNGEYVVNANSTARNRQLLDAINAGRPIRPTAMAAPVAAPRPVMVHIDATAAPGVEFEEGLMTDERVELIARRVTRTEAPKAVATHLQDPNSMVSKSITRVTTAKRKRG
jgi:hypothetical protein